MGKVAILFCYISVTFLLYHVFVFFLFIFLTHLLPPIYNALLFLRLPVFAHSRSPKCRTRLSLQNLSL